MKRILVTGIGGDIGQSITQCLRDSYEDAYLLGTDIHEKHAGKLFVDNFLIVPIATAPDYINRISEIVDKNKIDVVIPVNESEIQVLVNAPCNVPIISCGNHIVNAGLDKLKTIELLKSLSLTVPWTVDADKEDPVNYPCIIKPKFSSGSKSTYIVNSDTEARFFADRNPGCVFQELLEPHEKEVTGALYRTKNGRIESIQFERLLVGGLTGWAKVIFNSEVDKLFKIIADGLSLQGSMNVQLRITDRGPMIFEINPRFSSTVFMRHKLGFTDVEWSLREFFNEPVRLSGAKLGTTVVRTQDVVILEENN